MIVTGSVGFDRFIVVVNVQRRRAGGGETAAQRLQLRVANGDVLHGGRIGDLRVDVVAVRTVVEQPAAAEHELLCPGEIVGHPEPWRQRESWIGIDPPIVPVVICAEAGVTAMAQTVTQAATDEMRARASISSSL